MGGSKTTNYVSGGLQTALGAGLMFVPGAQGIAIPMMTAGVGQLAGTGAGGTKGGAMGEAIGGAVGGLGEGFGGLGPLGGMLGPADTSAATLGGLGSNIPYKGSIAPGGGMPGFPAGQALGPEDLKLIQQGAQGLSAAEAPGGQFGAGAGGGGIMDFLKSPGGGALAQGAMGALGGAANAPPPPPPPGMPPKSPAPPGPEVSKFSPAVSTVPQPGGKTTMPGGGDMMQQLALLRLLGGRNG